jgi:hypothetical protein
MNVVRIVALPTPDDQAPRPAFESRPLQDAVRARCAVGALTFPICNRCDPNQRTHSARPTAEVAVAKMEVEDENA